MPLAKPPRYRSPAPCTDSAEISPHEHCTGCCTVHRHVNPRHHGWCVTSNGTSPKRIHMSSKFKIQTANCRLKPQIPTAILESQHQRKQRHRRRRCQQWCRLHQPAPTAPYLRTPPPPLPPLCTSTRMAVDADAKRARSLNNMMHSKYSVLSARMARRATQIHLPSSICKTALTWQHARGGTQGPEGPCGPLVSRHSGL